jgi:hypothetical protein
MLAPAGAADEQGHRGRQGRRQLVRGLETSCPSPPHRPLPATGTVRAIVRTPRFLESRGTDEGRIQGRMHPSPGQPGYLEVTSSGAVGPSGISVRLTSPVRIVRTVGSGALAEGARSIAWQGPSAFPDQREQGFEPGWRGRSSEARRPCRSSCAPTLLLCPSARPPVAASPRSRHGVEPMIRDGAHAPRGDRPCPRSSSSTTSRTSGS